MKGIAFTILNQMVEETMGVEAWDEILDRVRPASEGVYISSDSYPDAELFAIVGALSEMTGKDVDDLLRAFGEYALPQFARRYPVFFENVNAKQFLNSIQDVIHVEVKKLFPDAQLPDLTYEDPAPDRLVMVYRSPRKLCRFAEGLIQGTAEYFDIPIQWTQAQCMAQGDALCRFELHFGNPD